MGTSSTGPAPAAAQLPPKTRPPARVGSELIPPRSREKLTNLMDLVATGLGFDVERRQELSGKLLEITAERLVRFDEACRALGHDDERIRTLALEEIAETLLDWVLVKVVLSLWENRSNGGHRGRKTKNESA